MITAVALNIGHYNTYLADWLWNSPEAIANVIASGYSSGTNNVQYLDTLMGKIFDLGEAYRKKAMSSPGLIPDFGLLLAAFAIWCAGAAATAYAGFLLVLAKMGLAIILAVGPIFVLLTIFEGTKRFFDTWMGQALNYVFLVMLTAAAIKLIFTIIQAYLGAIGTPTDPAFDQAIPAIVLCAIAFLVLVQVPSVASGLGGGVAMSTLGAVNWAYGKAKAGTAAGLAAGRDLLSGKTLSDMRAARRARETNARWAARNPAVAHRAARATGAVPLAVYRKVTQSRTSKVSRG